MTTTSKRASNRYLMVEKLHESFTPFLGKTFLKEKLKEIGGNSFSFKKDYMDHVKYYISSCIDYTQIQATEALFFFKNDLTSIPKCFCGNLVKFGDGKYPKTCSRKCNNSSEEINKKRRETTFKNFGTEVAFKSTTIKQKIKKTKEKNKSFGSYKYSISDKLENDFLPIYTEQEIRNILELDGGSVFYRKPNNMDHVKYFLHKRNFDYTSVNSAGELFHIFRNKIIKIPTCECGERLKFHYIGDQYTNFCSSSCAAKSKETKVKKQDAIFQKYGVLNYSQTDEFKDNFSKYSLLRNYESVIDPFKHIIRANFTKEEYKGKNREHIYNWTCLRCDNTFESNFFGSSLNRPRCVKCDGCYSDLETIIKNFLIEHDIFFQHKNRTILENRKELDFYIPEHNLAIEVNGLFYHNEFIVDKNYHLNKTNECEKAGIRLIHIFTDEFKQNRKIVRSRLRNIFKLNKYKIFARKCEVREINSKDSGRFLEKYHIQGNSKSPIRLGLFSKNRLVSVMTFSKPRSSLGARVKEENSYELVRFCAINNFTVIGGASKMLSYFEKTYNPVKITSYADRRWSMGELYKTLGFKFTHNTPMNYWYTKDFETRLHRFGFQKHLLEKKLEDYDKEKTEHENMLDHGYYRVYDCGSKKFEKCF
jgi:very-short-patch-repair endonuclease